LLELDKVHEGDCLELMKEIPDKSIDMILCDLPYGTTRNKWDSVIPLEPLWEQYNRVIKDNGAIVLTASQPFTTELITSNKKSFKYTLVWDKVLPTGFLNAKKMPLKRHEDVVVFYKRPPSYNPQMEIRGKERQKGSYNKRKGDGDSCYGKFENVSYKNNTYYPTSLLKFSNAIQKDKVHTTQKPVALFEYLIKTYTSEGEVVLDNCLGSGTTAIAAINTNRHFIGIEKEREYVDIANERIKQAKEGQHGES
jgi:site-specific DNA-methyltransferase (adenine-specific)